MKSVSYEFMKVENMTIKIALDVMQFNVVRIRVADPSGRAV